MNKLCFQDRLFPGFRKYGPNIAIRYGTRKVTYWELDKRSRCIFNWLLENGTRRESFIGIYIEDRIDFIAAVIGIIRAGCVFVPLDTGHPLKRIQDMLRITHTPIIFSDDLNRERLARDADAGGAGKGLKIVAVNDTFYHTHGAAAAPGGAGECEYSREDRIYVYFTSGSNGAPKAVVGKNKSLLHFVDWEISTFSIDETYRVSQLYHPAYDAFLRDVFVPLSAGGTVCIPAKQGIIMDGHQLIDWLDRDRINLIHCPPSLFKLFNNGISGMRNFKHLKYILLAGEKINPAQLKKWYDEFDKRIQLVNLYGPTETTMVKTFYFIDRKSTDGERVPIGKPMKGSRIFILDEELNICGEKATGEIYIRTPYTTLGYYNDPGLTGERFIPNPFSGDPNDLFYKTGDLGRLLPDGNIEFVGRIDRQVKIKGVRIEPGEIENAVLTHPAIREAVVKGLEDAGEEAYLCAYYVSGKELGPGELTEYLAVRLPAYSIPSRFVRMEKMPLLPDGKIDFNALPLPATDREETGTGMPENRIEQTLIKIWSEILEIDEACIGVHDSFTDLDGQSLKAIMMASWIHKEFNVTIPIHAIFELSTIKKLAGYIEKTVEEKYHTIAPAEEKEFYPLSPAQKRLYIIWRMKPDDTGYNVPQMAALQGNLDIEKLESAFNKLIKRHESLRTSFEIAGDEPVQIVRKTADFSIEYYEHEEEKGIIKNFIRPFNLEQAPIFRVGLIKTGEKKYVLMADLHHIVSDAATRRILLADFLTLYGGLELPDLRLQYKDYSQWVNGRTRQEIMKRQESYWLEQFARKPPLLNLPIDFPRPEVQDFEGGIVRLAVGKKETTALQKLALEENATMFMVLLALFNVFLSKISGREDIVIGTQVVGRRHADLQKIMGIFINTLPLRNYPAGEKTFKEFLSEVRKRSFHAFENQDYPFEDLVDRLSIKRDVSRNPLFNVMLAYQEVDQSARDISLMGLSLLDQDLCPDEIVTSKFDLVLLATFGDNPEISFEYGSKLFKRDTIEGFAHYFQEILKHITDEPGIKLSRLGTYPGIAKNHRRFPVESSGEPCIHPCVQPGNRYTPPGDKVEEKLAEIWTGILGGDVQHEPPNPSHPPLPPIGIDDNFFERGGNSFKAVKQAARIHKELHVNIPLIEIFKTPTIKSLSEYIKRNSGQGSTGKNQAKTWLHG
jgi:amino acid adenylation domain-containing protein